MKNQIITVTVLDILGMKTSLTSFSFVDSFIQARDLERELNQVKEKNKQLQMQLAASPTYVYQNSDRNNNKDGGGDVHQLTKPQPGNARVSICEEEKSLITF